VHFYVAIVLQLCLILFNVVTQNQGQFICVCVSLIFVVSARPVLGAALSFAVIGPWDWSRRVTTSAASFLCSVLVNKFTQFTKHGKLHACVNAAFVAGCNHCIAQIWKNDMP
jgi:hypothetical protein